MMGFLNNLINEKITWRDVNLRIQNDPNPIAKKWIYVYFSIYFSNDNEKHAIEQAAADMTLIINNTKAVFLGQFEEFLGCVNPYLGINTILSENGNAPTTMITQGKDFKYSLEASPNQYHIIIQPIKENSKEIDLYTLERLCYEMYMLGHASDYISKKYPIKIYIGLMQLN